MTGRVTLLLGLMGIAALLGCAGNKTVRGFEAGPGEMANVFVYLSNEGQGAGKVTLALYVDGRFAASRTLGPNPPNHPVEIPLRLLRGCHTVRVVAIGRQASRSTEIAVASRPLYVSAAFWSARGEDLESTEPAEVEIQVQDKPFGFC